jgi:DNA-binding response OmpR family regulator
MAVGVDSWMLAANAVEWRSAGFIVIPASTMQEAFDHFRNGDFDLVLLGNSLSSESKERLTYLIRTSSPCTPVVSIAKNSTNIDSFANATLSNDGNAILQGMRQLLAEQSRLHLTGIPLRGAA